MSSSPVKSSQPGVHGRLQEVVLRHLDSNWQQPIHQPSLEAFHRLLELPAFDVSRGLVLDSGCGTGASTRMIAERFPECLVIGVDQSADRLSRTGLESSPGQDGNMIFVRAELASFWRLALDQGWHLERHYILYPNPWPKPGQLQRRWHAHPVFPDLLRLGGLLELRCNWKIYAQEFEQALALACPRVEIQCESALSEASWDGIQTPFGRKYGDSGHRLYRLLADLSRCDG